MASPLPPGNALRISKLHLYTVYLGIGLSTLTRLITSPFRKDKARTYKRDVSYALLRGILSGFSALEGQHLSPSTEEVYKRGVKAGKYEEDIVDLGDGVKGCWLGKRDAKFVVMYCHGGGYIASATPGHMKYQSALQEHLRQNDADVSVFSLVYPLAPHSPFPSQLKAAVAGLRYLVEKENRDTSTIILGGDSAGANLTSALLLHLALPHDKVPSLDLKGRLRGAFLISPWINYSVEHQSFKANAQTDYLTITALNRASHCFLGSAEKDGYSEPAHAPKEWWRDVAAKTLDEILVWGGGGEVLIDGIKAFAGKIVDGFEMVEDGQGRAKFVVSPEEAHEEMIIDHVLKTKGEGEGGKQVKEWLVDVLKRDGPVKSKL